jgi:adenylate cyclase
MGVDEEGTLAQLKAHRRALVNPKMKEHRGRIVKTTGDGMLVEFDSVVDALRCAIEVQTGMVERNAHVPQEKRVEFRVGIHQGDVIIDGGDIFGDGVNVAARLEGLAEPGGICISGRVHEDAQGKLDIRFEDIGEPPLKNITRSVRVYRVRPGGLAPTSLRPAPPLPNKPSIAVLPFQSAPLPVSLTMHPPKITCWHHHGIREGPFLALSGQYVLTRSWMGDVERSATTSKIVGYRKEQ